MAEKLKEGDEVRLKTGNHMMTIAEIREEEETAVCVSEDSKGNRKTEEFALVVLTTAPIKR